MLDTIYRPDQETPEFLSEILQTAGHSLANVESFQSQPIGTGQMGKCLRYRLEYTQPDPSYPSSLIGKFASDDEGSKETAILTLSYLREVGFYQEGSKNLSIPIPKCYYAAIEDANVEHLILLEDLAPAQQGDQIVGCTPDLARTAILQLIGLHGPTWCDESLKTATWLAREDMNFLRHQGRLLYQHLLPGFIDRFSDAVTKRDIELFELLGASVDFPPLSPDHPVFCLTHQDYRLDNFLIDTQVNPVTITVVDWEIASINQPLTDVAYFLGSCLLPDVREQYETEIVKAYHSALLDYGITNFNWDDCWREYRRASFYGFLVTIVAGMMVQQTERGDRMLSTMIRRYVQQAHHLQARELFT